MIRRSTTAALALVFGTGTAIGATPAPMPLLMFTGVEVSDFAKSEAFYTQAIGMKKLMRLSKPTDPFIKDLLSFSDDPTAPGPMLILMHFDKPPEGRTHASGVLLGVQVADAHAAAAKVRAAGYAVLREPAANDRSAKLTTLVKDPDGNTIELVQLDMARMR